MYFLVYLLCLFVPQHKGKWPKHPDFCVPANTQLYNVYRLLSSIAESKQSTHDSGLSVCHSRAFCQSI